MQLITLHHRWQNPHGCFNYFSQQLFTSVLVLRSSSFYCVSVFLSSFYHPGAKNLFCHFLFVHEQEKSVLQGESSTYFRHWEMGWLFNHTGLKKQHIVLWLYSSSCQFFETLGSYGHVYSDMNPDPDTYSTLKSKLPKMMRSHLESLVSYRKQTVLVVSLVVVIICHL